MSEGTPRHGRTPHQELVHDAVSTAARAAVEHRHDIAAILRGARRTGGLFAAVGRAWRRYVNSH